VPRPLFNSGGAAYYHRADCCGAVLRRGQLARARPRTQTALYPRTQAALYPRTPDAYSDCTLPAYPDCTLPAYPDYTLPAQPGSRELAPPKDSAITPQSLKIIIDLLYGLRVRPVTRTGRAGPRVHGLGSMKLNPARTG
jgi:hypothetical protein